MMKPLDIRYVSQSQRNTESFNNVNKGIQAHRKVDFVLNHYTFYSEAQFSDVVLLSLSPTPWGKDGEVLQSNGH